MSINCNACNREVTLEMAEKVNPENGIDICKFVIMGDPQAHDVHNHCDSWEIYHMTCVPSMVEGYEYRIGLLIEAHGGEQGTHRTQGFIDRYVSIDFKIGK